MNALEGKVAIVTGASRGIGAGIAKELAVQGARVVVNYRLGNPEDLAKAAVFLASDESRWVTGDVIKASGGMI